jgi:hypothetical protein
MLRKTMIVLAQTAALTGGLTVVAFAHRSGRGHWGGFGGSGHMGGALGLALFGLVLASSRARRTPTTSRAAKPACTTR